MLSVINNRAKFQQIRISMDSDLKSRCQRKLCKPQQKGVSQTLHTNTTDSLGGLMDGYTRDSSLSVLVLEIHASLSVTPVGAISTPKFGQVS